MRGRIPPNKEGVRTKDAHRTPAKGHRERALADAPFGAWLKALLLYLKLGGFSVEQCLDAHASIRLCFVQCVSMKLLSGVPACCGLDSLTLGPLASKRMGNHRPLAEAVVLSCGSLHPREAGSLRIAKGRTVLICRCTFDIVKD